MNPFTYQFFLSAIHSYDDKMLMYFIDEAVGIYCRLTGKAVCPRPASPKDYNAEYADAYEVANYAVFIVARKMGSYNPQEEFRPYLRKALENAIKDILKEDGEGDFFNKTAHRKKKRDEEPEQHQRVNIDSLYGPSGDSSEPDNEASERAGRIMKHSNDALEAMIKFVDSLPEMKRAALYASAFGQALRPDLENYGRNYADILAGIYNTTAIYIRKLAAEGKKAALAEVRRQGFSESSMAEVSMGFIQAKTPPRDIHDEVIRAIEKLSPYQQFMFLRHLSSIKKSDNSITTMTFKYTQQNATLTPSQEVLLDQIENAPCPFNDINSLKDLKGISGVSVVVADKAFLVKLLDDCIAKIEEQISKYRNDNRRSEIFRQIERDIYDRCNWAKQQKQKASLLGLYSRKLLWFDNSSPTVFLFADNINDYAASIGKRADNIFGYVFIHEMMHAYYDSFNSAGFPSWEKLEEPFAEFGMLTFIKESKLPNDLLMDARDHVQSKIASGPREYGFGLELFNRAGKSNLGMINTYREISNWIDADIIRTWKSPRKYFFDINLYIDNPNDENANNCYDGVKEILDYPWKEPHLIIKPGIRVRRTTSCAVTGPKHRSFPILPRLYRDNDWAVTASKVDWHFQYPLIQSDDLVQLFVEVLKVMKHEGLESCLSITDSKLKFLGRYFSDCAPTKDSSYYTIPESLNVKGTVVFPAFRSRLLGGPSGYVGNILYALGILLDGTFTLVHEGPNFVLYGPGHFGDLFSMETKSTSSAATLPAAAGGKGKVLQIIDKSSSRVLSSETGMPKTVLFIVKDYCSKHPGITLADLQRIFRSVPNHSNSKMNIIESAGNVSTYIATHPPKPGGKREQRFFEDSPITLTNGEVIMVSNQWAGSSKKVNFDAFKKVAEDLGYIIK